VVTAPPTTTTTTTTPEYTQVCRAESQFSCHSACRAHLYEEGDVPDYKCSQCNRCSPPIEPDRCARCQNLFAEAGDNAEAVKELAEGQCKDLPTGCGCPSPNEETSCCETGYCAASSQEGAPGRCAPFPGCLANAKV
jgi:hypothetical protein